MRYQDEQTRDEQPETVRSNPVPVAATSPETDRDERADGFTEETVDDRGSYDRDGRPEGTYDADGVRRDDDEVTFHEPAPTPTAFGATSVGEDVAAVGALALVFAHPWWALGLLLAVLALTALVVAVVARWLWRRVRPATASATR